MSTLWACVVLPAVGCDRSALDEPSAVQPTSMLELLTWWRSPGEVDALKELTRMYMDRHAGVRVFNASAGRSDVLQRILSDRLEAYDPPDLMQVNVREIRQLRVRFPHALQNLDDWVDAMGLRSWMLPEGIADVTSEGHVLAVPINFHRHNSLIYNKAIFAAHGLKPPETVADLVTVCTKLKSAGVTPIATAHQGWMLTIMFNSIAAGHMGSRAFRDFFTGADQSTLPRLREALLIFQDLVAHSANPDAAEEGFGWTNAAQALYNGDAAMFIHGDWVKAYLTQLGWRPGVDFDVIAAPGTADMFLYTTDSFSFPIGAKNASGARDFLAMATSPEAQVAFNEIKGSSPIRLDVQRAALDPVARATFVALERASIRMSSPNSNALDEAMMRFVKDGDLAHAEAAFVGYAQSAR